MFDYVTCVVTIHIKSLSEVPMHFELGVISNEIYQGLTITPIHLMKTMCKVI
jgi:hypothetical protein